MVTTAYVQNIFHRHGWSYQLGDDGSVRANFEGGVRLIVFLRQDGVLVATIAFHAEGRDRQAIQARSRDLELVLASINAIAPGGYFEYDQNHADSVFYSTYVPFTGNIAQDDPRLAQAIHLNIGAVKGVGPLLAALVRGEISTQQALDVIVRALGDNNRGRGVA